MQAFILNEGFKMQDIKNWNKLTDYEQYLSSKMIEHLESGGGLFMVSSGISKSGISAKFMVFLILENQNVLFDFSIIQKLEGNKTSGAKAFKINAYGSDRGLEVLRKIKKAFNIKNQMQNYNCYYAD